MRRWIGVVVAVSAMCLAWVGDATAGVPSQRADPTWMVDRIARTVRFAGGRVWVGGDFDAVLRPDGSRGHAVPGLTAFHPRTGGPARVRVPRLGSSPIVFDMSLGRGGVLYVAGEFTYSIGGRSGENLIGIDPRTGAVLRVFRTPKLWSVLAAGGRVYAGGKRLLAYRVNGSLDRRFRPVQLRVDDSLRSHKATEQIRDLLPFRDDIIAIGKFDYINGSPQKVAVRVDARSGRPAPWDLAGIQQKSSAFGHAGAVRGKRLYVAAGGSDFTAAYRASNGRQVWKTDTSGSSQTLTIFDRSTLIVGGHFKWVARSKGQQCGNNQDPNPRCFDQPRLVAMNLATGKTNTSWKPEICCAYIGVWGLGDHRGSLHVAGAFTQAGGRAQEGYARFS
jgi:outer membrane protein assembly factor BamB